MIMKKGDKRKQEILSAAEELFCRQGYEQTSVQDIIDRLNTSKGSFYHHFSSKESLLEGICSIRAEKNYNLTLAEAEKTDSVLRKIDIHLSGMIPLSNEKLSFLLMLLPVFGTPEGKTVRQYYCDALSGRFHGNVSGLLESGHLSGELYCADPENTATLILSMVNLLWVRITDSIIEAEILQRAADLAGCLRLTECCRKFIEQSVSLPYGSLSLIRLPELRLLSEQIHNHWERK